MSARVLLVEDEADLARGVRFNLEHEGHTVVVAGTAAEARKQLAAAFDLLILDLNLPDGDGLDLLRELRGRGAKVPVLCLTARAQETDVVMGLGLGADDYLRKPFGLAELLARVAALLRRGSPRAEPELRLGAATLDRAAQRIVHPDRVEELTPIEMEILDYLLRHRGQALERKKILADLWGLDDRTPTRTLDNHVARLRKKIEVDAANPAVLVTVHGVGYRLEKDGTNA